MRADRLVSLALLLQARGRMSARGLAAELEVSVRTVYRDIAALNVAGVPVVTESGPGGGCWLLEGYRFPLRGLSGDEAEALLVLGVPAAVAELGLADALAAAQRKIRVSSGASGASGASGSVAAVGASDARGEAAGAGVAGGAGGLGGAGALVHLDLPRWFGASEAVPWLRTVATAARGRRRLRIGYRRGDRDGERGAESSRVVCPLGLVNKAGIWYLVAAAGGRPGTADSVGDSVGDDPDRGDLDPTVFRVGRVTSALVLTDVFDRPPDFDLAAFWGRWSASFVTSRPRLEVRVRASAGAIAVFPEVFGDAVRPALDAATPTDERGFSDVALTFEHEAAAVQRLAGFGGLVEVLSPPAVRARLIATARALLGRYDAGE
jgi:predicted DNA-binding transcriptional regulator YafY